MVKRVLLVVLGLAILAVAAPAAYMAVRMGPKDFLGKLRYDQRHPGRLAVGDRAPDVTLTALDGTPHRLLEGGAGRPTVLVFGSYT